MTNSHEETESVDEMIEVCRLGEGDETIALEAIHLLKPAEERDGMDASPEHMRRLLGHDGNYLYLATEEGRPVGFLLAYRMQRVDRDQDMVYLYEIAVVPELRRRGIGSSLIRKLKDDCRRAYILKVWVGTETDNTAARALYESTGAECQGETNAEYIYTDF